jgi:hypothetical protein
LYDVRRAALWRDKAMPDPLPAQQSTVSNIVRQNPVATAGILVLAAIILVPIWSVHYPPILDFPNHLASSFVLFHLHDAQFNFGEYFRGDWGPTPYITTDFLMGALSRVMPALAAGKLVLSLGALGLPLAAWFFLRQVNPGENAVALWFLLASQNIFFRYGFVGFYCSLSLMLITLGLWLRFLKEPSALRWLATCGALIATYFTHIMGFAFCGLIVALYSVTRPCIREWIQTGALFVPCLTLYFLSSRVAEKQSSGAGFRTLSDKLDAAWMIMHSDSHLLDEITLIAVLAFFIFAWLFNKEFHWQWRWVVVAAGLMLTFVALPVDYGDGYDIDIRALPVIFIMIFVTARMGRRAWKLAPFAILLFAARTYDLTKVFHAEQPALAGYAESFYITPRNARVLPIIAQRDNDEDPIEQYYDHFWAYGVINRGWYSPYLFQVPGLLPLRLKKETYAPDGFWDLSYNEKLELDSIQKDYDYVYAFNVPDYEEDLRSIGDVIYTSGKLELFRIRPPNNPVLTPIQQQNTGK